MSEHNSLCNNFILNGSKCKYPAGLYLVGTPIGNLEDITLRALFTLQKADLIACEDTRVTKKLLFTYGIHNQLVTYNDATGDHRGVIKQALLEGKRVALVSDAGMPLIADPGFKLVEFAHENEIYVTCVPGPSATLAALTLSGLPSHAFTFRGFFPKKASEIKVSLDSLIPDHTYIFFETPKRIQKTVEQLHHHGSIDRISIARELTKAYEQVICGTPEAMLMDLKAMPLKGELVLTLHTKPVQKSLDCWDEDIIELLRTERVKTIVDLFKDKTPLSKKELYAHILTLKETYHG